MPDVITVSRETLEAAFTEWERRWRTEPDRFMSDYHRLGLDDADYGAQATAYLFLLISERTHLGGVGGGEGV